MTMRRREFIGLASGAAVGWSLAASAQPARKLPVIGFLHPGFPDNPGLSRLLAFDNLKAGLRQAGHVDGETIRIEARFGLGKPETLARFAEELVRIKVDVLVVAARPAIEAAKAATRDIPIIALDLESDPVASGYVASLAVPGGNITGLFLDAPSLAAKWLQQVREVVLDARKMAVLWDANTGEYQLRALSAAVKTMSVDVQVIEFRNSAEMEPALIRGLKEGPQALIQLGSPLIQQLSNRIADICATHRMPAVSMFRSFPDSGGLMSYGPVLSAWYQLLGTRYVDAILKGARAADLAVDRPTRFEMVLNAKAATAMGLKIPVNLLAQADEVIE